MDSQKWNMNDQKPLIIGIWDPEKKTYLIAGITGRDWPFQEEGKNLK